MACIVTVAIVVGRTDRNGIAIGTQRQTACRYVTHRFTINVVASLLPRNAVPVKNAHLTRILPATVIEKATDRNGIAIGA